MVSYSSRRLLSFLLLIVVIVVVAVAGPCVAIGLEPRRKDGGPNVVALFWLWWGREALKMWRLTITTSLGSQVGLNPLPTQENRSDLAVVTRQHCGSGPVVT